MFAICVASDSLYIVILSVPLLCVALLLFLSGKYLNQRVRAGALYVISATLTGLAVQRILDNLNVVSTYFNTDSKLTLIAFDAIGPSIVQSLKDIINLSGADIFNKPINLSIVAYVVCFVVMILGANWIYKNIKYSFKINKKIETKTLMSIYLALSVAFLLIAYISTGKAVVLAGDIYVSAESFRYLTLIPFVLALGAAIITSRLKIIPPVVSDIILPSLIGILILVSIPSSITQYRQLNSRSNTHIAAQQDVVRKLKQENVIHAVTGYWYSGTVRFWSEDSISSSSVAACNIAEPKFNNRHSWYAANPSKNFRSALIIDRSPQGFDRSYWAGCTDEILIKIYGKPVKTINPVNPAVDPFIWIYDYDVRSRVNNLNIR